MRLLKLRDDELILAEFFDNDIPPYAILSHTWEQITTRLPLKI
jgi:hypothetical protein